MQKYFDSITNKSGDAISGVAIEVLKLDGSLATIYSDNSGLAKANPIISDALGYFEFYAADGRYNITISGFGFTTRSFTDILLEDQSDGLASLSVSTGATLIGWIRSATGAVAATLSELFDWGTPSLFDFVPTADRAKFKARTFDADLDVAPYILAAHNHCVAAKKSVCRIPAGGYPWRSAITLTGGSVQFIGSGKSITANETSSSGTWIKIFSNAFTPCKYIDNTAAGSGFSNLAISQVHPTPANGWTPTVYPVIFDCNNVAGEMFFNDLYTPAIYKLVDSFYSGRLNINRWRGQSFLYTAKIEGAYDSCHLDDWHDWPYWSQHPAVMGWTQQNGTGLEMGRVDTPFVDNMFSFAKKATIHTYNSVAGPLGGMSQPGGNAALVSFGKITSDASKYGSVWIESDNFTGHIENYVSQGEAVPQGTGTPVTGGYGLKVTGLNARFSIGKIHCERYNNECVRVEGGGTVLTIGQANFSAYNYNGIGSGGTSGAVRVHTASSVIFNGQPYLNPILGGVLCDDGVGVLTGMQVNETAAGVNGVRGTTAPAGASPSLFAFGLDAVIGLFINSKGAGSRVRIGSNVATTASFDCVGSANAPLLIRNGTNAAQIYVEGGGNSDLELIPSGAGLVKINATLNTLALTPTKYINVKVADGSTVRLLVG
jgi:hypothetical protein